MFKTTGSGHAKKPAGGWGSYGKSPKDSSSSPGMSTDEVYTEQRLAGKVYMKEALNVACPPTQKKGRVTNRDGKTAKPGRAY